MNTLKQNKFLKHRFSKVEWEFSPLKPEEGGPPPCTPPSTTALHNSIHCIHLWSALLVAKNQKKYLRVWGFNTVLIWQRHSENI